MLCLEAGRIQCMPEHEGLLLMNDQTIEKHSVSMLSPEEMAQELKRLKESIDLSGVDNVQFLRDYIDVLDDAYMQQVASNRGLKLENRDVWESNERITRRLQDEIEGLQEELRRLLSGPVTVCFCEFTGDDTHDFDEVGFKKSCEHLGFVPEDADKSLCLKHNKSVWKNVGGWRLCCDECEKPIQVVDQRP
jgi:hypothetical protein